MAKKIAHKKSSAKSGKPAKAAVKTPPDKSAVQSAEKTKVPTKAADTKHHPVETPVEIASPQTPAPASSKKSGYATAEDMAKAQRSISVSEFFAKNRHLLGFDNPRKALLTTVKEAVDNALDACEEAGILPVVDVTIQQHSETHFCVAVQDNGPGIVRKEIPNIFGRLLYGSKFHRLRMSRGQQGIGISAAGMYGLLTTGKPIRILSRTSTKAKAHYYELQIDTRQNRPDIIADEPREWDVPHGTRVEIELEAKYQRGRQSVDDYLQQTAIANPHVTLIYHSPDGRSETHAATVKELPPTPKAIKPHPHGVELGVLLKMLTDTRAKTLQQFLTSEFSRVSPRVAQEILQKASLAPSTRPHSVNGDAAKAIFHAVRQTKIMAPATDCVAPIGEDQLLSGLQQVVQAEFYAACTRSPAVYRGNPFLIEAAIAYGKPPAPEGEAAPNADAKSADGQTPPQGGHRMLEEEDDRGEEELARIVRFANRVPLLYQQSACSIYKSVAAMNWRLYGLSQSRGALPAGDLCIVVHIASVWVPFTSESKEAVASYPEILKEIRLALQECGRKLGMHIRKAVRLHQEMKKRSYIETYIPAIGEALRDILELKEKQVQKVCSDLKTVLERSRKM